MEDELAHAALVVEVCSPSWITTRSTSTARPGLVAVHHHPLPSRGDRRDHARGPLEVNRDTVALLDELITTCAEAADPAAPALHQRLAALQAREQASRRVLAARVCELRQAMRDHAHRVIGLARAAPAPADRLLQRVARHAAAAVLAIGLASCGGSGPAWQDDAGVIEAPPPPMDAGTNDGTADAPPPDARPADLGLPDDASWQEDGGVIEAPPPPMNDD